MKYEHPLLKQVLAAEYVLGTLSGRSRRRFARLLRSRGDLRAEVRDWERCLAGLEAGFTPQTPPAQVWSAIEQQINHIPAPPRPRQRAVTALRVWQAWAGLATAAALVLAIGLQRERTRPLPAQIVRVEVPVPQVLPYVALLQPSGSDAKWLVTLSPERRRIRVTGSGRYPLDPTRESLELWLLGDDGPPRSLGVLPAEGDAELPMPRGMTMPDQPTLALSREPAGGSPTGRPTGPVLLATPAQRAG